MIQRLRTCLVLLLPCFFLCGMLWLQGRTVPASAPVALPASSDNWGLSFPNEGQSPVGNASVEDLAKYDAYFLGDTGKKVIYLTFDCGYENGYTETILDALKKHNAPAAFFVVGNMVETAPDIIRRMSTTPADILGLARGHMSLGAVADLVIFDPDEVWTVDPDQFASKARNTPFAGRKLRGKIKYTIAKGKVIYQDGG